MVVRITVPGRLEVQVIGVTTKKTYRLEGGCWDTCACTGKERGGLLAGGAPPPPLLPSTASSTGQTELDLGAGAPGWAESEAANQTLVGARWDLGS